MADPNGEQAGIAFLAENKGKDGVITLASGLQYRVLTEGSGVEHPKVGTPCECHYAGRLLDGTEFDSSYKRGSPSTFAPNQVIKGWTEAMQLMVQGDKWEMYIPYELAYGAHGKPPKIPAAACLIFIMEIVKIKGETAPKADYPEWTADELALWLDKDEAACQKWRDSKITKYEEGDASLAAIYTTRAALDVYLDATCLGSKNKSLWKRTRAAKKKAGGGGDAAAAAVPAAPPALTQASARTLLDKALVAFKEPANKAKLLAAVAEVDAGPPESAQMMKMMKLMPLVQEMMAAPLQAVGFGAGDLMNVVMQIQAFAATDPTIAADRAKLMSAVQGDVSALYGDDSDAASGGDVEYAVALRQHMTAALNEILAKQPEDPFKAMQQVLFQASLGDGTPPTVSPVEQTAAMSEYLAKYDLMTHVDDVVAKKGKGSGPVGGVKFMISDAGDVFTELSKKLKAGGGQPMTAEELKALDAAAAKAKREKTAKEEAERDAKDAENALKQAKMEAEGKKVSGGLHKFDASEVDINGGAGTADDFMDAFGF